MRNLPILLILLALTVLVACVGDDDDSAIDDDFVDDDIADDDVADDDQADDDLADDDVTDDDAADDDSADDDVADDDTFEPPPTVPITGVTVENAISYQLTGRIFPRFTGDLWPAAWADDGHVYAANGDGFAFGWWPTDIAFSRIEGDMPLLRGSTSPAATGAQIACLYPPRWRVSRKPTGLTCVDGKLYLFFQNLANFASGNEFGEAPNASISVSEDHGLTWQYDREQPMFSDFVFTTGFFLDYGRCGQYAQDEYVYVYGLDYNWRFSPGFLQTKLFLARVPRDRVMQIEAWEFVSGLAGGEPQWSGDIEDRAAVLEDDTQYMPGQSGIAQGSIVYIPQLNRYLYSSWADCCWVFYEAEQPWGPWTRITVIDWSQPTWTPDFHGGYATVIPTKYLEPDGSGGWIVSAILKWQDNAYYNFGMRRFWIQTD